MPSISHLIHAYGLIVVAAVVGSESLGIPVPGETALIVASVIAGTKHELNILSVILTAATAAIGGRMIGYLIGRQFGYWLLLRYGGYVGITEKRIKLGQYLFMRHGGKIIIIAQFIPILRTLAGILAGANRMPWRHFVAASVASALLWATFFGLAGYSLGREVEQLAGSMVIILGIATVIALIIAAGFIRRHESELVARAELALPGPLQLP